MRYCAKIGWAALVFVFPAGVVCAQTGSPAAETTASLVNKFAAADGIAAKERLLYRIAERGGEAGKYLLEAAKKAGDADTRWLAIRGLGMVKFREAAPFLLESLGSPEHYVRANSARALGEIGYRPAAAALIDLLKTEKDAGVTEQTALALRMIDAREGVPVLKSRMASAGPQTQSWLLDSIRQLGSGAEAAYVARYLYGADDDPRVAIVAECAARSLDSLAHGEIGLPPPGGIYDPWTSIRKARKWWEKRGQNRFR